MLKIVKLVYYDKVKDQLIILKIVLVSHKKRCVLTLLNGKQILSLHCNGDESYLYVN